MSMMARGRTIEKQWSRDDAAIDAIYAAASAPERFADALDLLADRFRAEGSWLICSDAEGASHVTASRDLAVAAQDYVERGWKLDFLAARAQHRRTSNGLTCYADTDIARAEEIASHPFYVKFRAGLGLGPLMGGLAGSEHDISIALTVHRASGDKAFAPADVSALARLLPHFDRALRLALRLQQADQERTALLESMGRLSCGVVMLDSRQRITHANDRVRAMLGNGIQIDDGQLSIDGPAGAGLVSAICEVLAGRRCAQDACRLPILAHPRPGIPGPVLYVLPLPQGPLLWPQSGSRVLIVMLANGQEPQTEPLVLRSLLGLTLGEARVASMIGAGLSPRQAAQALNITEPSARTVLKRIFHKVGVSRQSDLVAMLSRITLQ
jgi:DNA-binding CsgD family transcriptional regulator